MPPNPQIPKELAELLATATPVSDDDARRMKAVAEEADQDPSIQAELQSAMFVNSILNAMKEEGMSKSDLARKLGRSRQYLNRVLDEDEPGNFTVDTLSELANATNRKLAVLALRQDEYAHVGRCDPRSFNIFVNTDFFPIKKVEYEQCVSNKILEVDFSATGGFMPSNLKLVNANP
jgi:transcriptional regulator with XRE-family HTH domain